MPENKKRFLKNKKKERGKNQLTKWKRDKYGKKPETWIEKKVRELLEEHGVPFTAEYPVGHYLGDTYHYKVYDFYINYGENRRFVIETHGDRWHCKDYLEGKQPKSKLNSIQKKNLANDKVKEDILKDKGIPLVVIWEYDIKWNWNSIKNQILDRCYQLNKS